MLIKVQAIYLNRTDLFKILILKLLLSFWTISAFASEPDNLFLSEEIIRLELRSDFKAIEASRTGDAEYFDGELIYSIPGGKTEKFSVKVMVQGKLPP